MKLNIEKEEKMTHLARTGLTVCENGSVVPIQNTLHQSSCTDIVDVLLLDLVVEHGIEEEILRWFGVARLGISHTDLSAIGIRPCRTAKK